jgi:phosphohistidine phosphatase
MKYLTVLRHGLAEPGFGREGDFLRPLSPEGKTQITRLSEALKQRHVHFDLAVCSTAKRTMETKAILSNFIQIASTRLEDQLYEAGLHDLLLVICSTNPECSNLLVIGHNPGLSSLLSYFSGENNLNLMPGMMARMEFFLEEWNLLDRNTGILVEILQ